MSNVIVSLWFIGSYVIGSVPSGAWLSWWYGIPDITKVGSGNIGATNVGRQLGLRFFLIVLLLDSLKAYLMLYVAYYRGLSFESLVACALCLMIGNGYSLFLRGKGGKGVATGLALAAFFVPLVIPYSFAFWCAALAVTRTIGIASFCTLLTLPAVYYMIYGFFSLPLLFLVCFIAAWGMYKHIPNLRAYAQG